MKRLFFLLIILPICALSQTRYIDNVFDSVTVTNDVVYGQNVTVLPMLQGQPPAVVPLLCDIYEPKNDSYTDRPVIILMHTGNFLPPVLNGQPTGSKSDNSVVENCMRWAKKGYVAVAISYRQGWNPTSSSQAIRTATNLQASYRGIHDSKAMVRHLRKTANVDGNPYGIDESKIIIGGQGTGGFLSIGYATLDTISELLIYPKFWDTSDPNPSNHTPYIIPDFGMPGPLTYGYGNIDGTDTTYFPANTPPFNFPNDVLWNIGNNPSYSSSVSMVFNLGGALPDLSWLDGNQVPHVSFHCENDPFSPIDSGVIIVPSTGDIVIPDVVGSRTTTHYNTLLGNNAGFNQAGLTDTLTQMANSYNSAWDAQHGLVYDGLYVFDTPAPSTTPNAFGEMPYHESSPWDWWDLATYDAMFAALNGAPAGYGAANSLLGSPNSGSDSIPMMYLDTIHGYLNPRIYEVLFGTDAIGCTDSLAQNFNSNALVDDGSCLYCDLSFTISSAPPSSSSTCDGFAFLTTTSSYPILSYSWDNSIGIQVSTNNYVTNLCSDAYIINAVDSIGCTFTDTLILGDIYGCTDSNAFNYSWIANIDDGSCTYCLTTVLSSVSPSSPASCDGFALATSTSSFPILSYSWTNSQGTIISTSNYITNLCADAYILTVLDSVGCSTVDTLFLGNIYGCTDSTALNFSWFSNIDDGSCIPVIYGCTNPQAYNYDSLANIDDGSCCISQYNKIGQTITSTESYDRTGFATAISDDGNSFAVGSPYASSYRGLTRLYTKVSDPISGISSWTQTANFIGESPYDRSGMSLSLSGDGNIVAIGAPQNDGNGNDAGHVRIFENLSGLWFQKGQDIDGEYSGDQSGGSVSLSTDGNTIAIGARYNDGGGNISGHVRIYEYISGTWTQVGIDINGQNNDQSGRSVSLSGDGNTVAIGAPERFNEGTVRLYTKISDPSFGTWTWTQIGQDINGSYGDMSGISVSLSSTGDIVAIGSPKHDNWKGTVRLYENLGNNWSQIGADIDGRAGNDQSGRSVSLSNSGSTVAIGAPNNDSFGGNSGHVRLFTRISSTGISSWSQIGQDIHIPNPNGYTSYVGNSVSLSGDGKTVGVGAQKHNVNSGSYYGYAFVFGDESDCAGCIDPLALNYDSTYLYDDGSCIYPSGCTDPTAYNFDSIAITDDGSCLYCDLTNTFLINNNSQGNCDGFILANSSTSNGPISYLWNTGSTQNNIIGLCAGVYSVVITDHVGCTLEDTVFMNVVPGCMDPTALNYDPLATVDDGSCTYSSNCTSPKPTGLFAFDVIDTRAKVSWDNMNDPNCMVWKYFVRYREVGTSGWTTKSAGVGNGLCNFGLNTVTKQLLNLTPSTTYEFRMKAFYCGGTSSNYSTPVQFTTADPCPDMTNLTATTFNSNQSKVRFNWDTTGVYTFARILLRVDVPGSNWQTAGGFGVYYPTFFVNKFGLTVGENYRAQGRTFCDSNITAYRSPTWTAPIFWTQPGSIKLDGGTAINNLDVYPNPSRDVFNISFNSDKRQDLTIRILNVVGGEVYREDKQQFVGEYIKQISLDNYGKGIYFLEIQTSQGIVNKKLILQ